MIGSYQRTEHGEGARGDLQIEIIISIPQAPYPSIEEIREERILRGIACLYLTCLMVTVFRTVSHLGNNSSKGVLSTPFRHMIH